MILSSTLIWATTSILRDYLPNDHTDFIGTHMLNYDVSALDNVRSIELIIGAR